MRQKQKLCVVKSSKAPIFPFNIFLDPKYHLIKIGNDESTVKSIGIWEVIKQFEMLTIEEE